MCKPEWNVLEYNVGDNSWTNLVLEMQRTKQLEGAKGTFFEHNTTNNQINHPLSFSFIFIQTYIKIK